MEAVDGNAIAGLLHEVFGTEMTDAPSICASCGDARQVAELAVYRRGPGAVVCCRRWASSRCTTDPAADPARRRGVDDYIVTLRPSEPPTLYEWIRGRSAIARLVLVLVLVLVQVQVQDAACPAQGMARVRSGQASAWPLASDRNARIRLQDRA